MTEKEMLQRIAIDPRIMVGKPVISGTRLTVEYILKLLARGWSEEEILRNWPGLTHEDVQACLAYGSGGLEAETGIPWRAD